MAQFRTKILIIGILCIAVAASLMTVLILYGTGNLVTDPVELVYTVFGAQKVYDGEPLKVSDYVLESGELLEGHTANVKTTGSQTDAGFSEGSLEVSIVDKNGFDVTKKYAVKVNAGLLTVTPQTLSVAIVDAQAIYNGREVEFDKFEILSGRLASGHRIAAASANATLMNVGDRLPADMAPVIYDAAGNTVTKNYLIAFNIGNVRIVPRPITIKPKDATKIYDGTPLTATEYELTSGTLAAGQSVKAEIITEAGNAATATDANGGERIVINEANFKIFGDDGETEVSGNYAVTFETAYLTVEKRGITLLTASDSWEYDGDAHRNDGLDIVSGSLAPNQQLTVTAVTEVKDVEEGVRNELSFELTLSDGTPVDSDNYNISLRYGVLKVTPKNITVYAKNYSKVYDKKSFGDYLDKRIAAGEALYEVSPKLGEKFEITAEVDDAVKQQTDVDSGTYSLEINVYNDGTVCNDNFSVTVISGQYAITKKPVSVTLKNITKTYTGTEFFPETEEAFDAEEVTGYGLNTTDFKLQPLGVFKNADTYNYTAKFDGDSRNYEITVGQGVFTINKKEVTLLTGNATVAMTYNGQFYNPVLADFYIDGNPEYSVIAAEFDKKFVIGERTAENGLVEKYGVQNITALSARVSAGKEDITDNLIIDVSGANVTVRLFARMLNVTYSTYTYIGDDINNIDQFALAGYATATACADDVVTDKFASINYDENTFRLDCTIKNKDGVDVTFLYEIDPMAYGTIIVQAP